MYDNRSLGIAGFVLLVVALALLLLQFLPAYIVIGILALLSALCGFSSINTGLGKLTASCALVLVGVVLLYWMLIPRSNPQDQPTSQNQPQAAPLKQP